MRGSRRLLEIGLAILVLAALGWIAHLRRSRPAAPAGAEVRLPAGFGDLAVLRHRIGPDTFLVEARGTEYWLRRPFRERADPLFVLEVQRRARDLAVARTLPDTAGAPYGLDPPRGAVRLTSSAGEEWELLVGDETPLGGQRYARLARPGAPVVLLDGFAVRKYFLPELDLLRDPAAVSLAAGPPDSVIVRASGGDLVAHRRGPDRWRAARPSGLEIDPARLNPVVQLLRGPNIQGFPPESANLDSLGLRAPRATWILCQGARRESVRIGRTTPDLAGVFIRPAGGRPPAILDMEHFRSLVDGWPALVDRHLLSLPRDSLITIDLLPPEAGGFQRSDSGWVRRKDGRLLERQEAIATDAGNLMQLQWRSWPLRPGAPAPGASRLRLRLASASRAETLELAAASDSFAWARSSRRRAWGTVSETTWSIWSYRARAGE